MITPERVEELRTIYNATKDAPESRIDLDAWEVIETLSALWAVAKAGSEIEDILEVPKFLGDHSSQVCQKAIDNFREKLTALRQPGSGEERA